MGSWHCKAWTFLIGLVAGAAPFLAMAYVPHLQDPKVPLIAPDFLAIFVIAILVAFSTAIMESRKFFESDPREVFMRSLAIPSILLATVTGLKAHQDVMLQQDAYYSHVDAAEDDVDVKQVPVRGKVKVSLAPSSRNSWNLGAGIAEAQDVAQMLDPASLGTSNYLVTLGTYGTSGDADAAARRWRRDNALVTERYVQKSVRIYSIDQGVFYVTYTTPLTRPAAVKLFKLLRFNERDVTPQIIELTPTGNGP